jgi:hypothetical protein
MGTLPCDEGNIPNSMPVLRLKTKFLLESGHKFIRTQFLHYTECCVYYKVQLGNVAELCFLLCRSMNHHFVRTFYAHEEIGTPFLEESISYSH